MILNSLYSPNSSLDKSIYRTVRPQEIGSKTKALDLYLCPLKDSYDKIKT